MATKRGQLDCTTSKRNVGYGSCVLDWKIVKGALLYDSPRTFTEAEIADLQATLEADAANPIKANRMYPMHDFLNATDSSEDLTVETFDYGSKVPVREGDNDWSFQYTAGGACKHNSLRTHNGEGGYVLFYDKDLKIMGWNKTTGFSTIPLQFFHAIAYKLPTGSTTAKYIVRFVFPVKYSNEEVDFVKSPFDLQELEGLKDIDIKVNSWNQDTGVINATLQLSCGAENIYDLFQAQLDENSFTAYDEDGNTVDVSTVQGLPNKTFDITLNPAELPDNGRVTLVGAALDDLVTQGIIGFEINSVEVTVVGS